MIKTRNLTCIVCPRGCALTVGIEDGTVRSISGNLCPRGKKYAEDECIHPMRTVTTTIKTDNGGVVAVKTDRTIPKESVFECMSIINKSVAVLPVRVGDVIITDVFGANIVATQNILPEN